MKETRFASMLCAIALALGPIVWVAQAQNVPPEVLRYADTVL